MFSYTYKYTNKIVHQYYNNEFKIYFLNKILKNFSLIDIYHGYIVKLSSIIQSPSKTKYFTLTMHDGNDSKSLVSYNTRLYGTSQIEEQTSKINFSESVNQINDKLQVKMGYQSLVDFSTEDIPFSQAEEILTLQQIISNGCVGKMVNVVARVDLDNSEVEEINTNWGCKVKKDATIYDDSTV